MDGMLSQDEINALLNGMDLSADEEPDKIGSSEEVTEVPRSTPSETGDEQGASTEALLTDVEKDAIGEVANISMGSSATTLYSLVNRKVNITTPVVQIATWNNLLEEYERPCVFIQIKYTEGLDGTNILVLKEHDVKVITDLMMGGDGTNTEGELGELHLSAISEAMNQMMGSAATSLSSMLNKTIDISPPHADLIDLQENVDEGTIDEFLKNPFVKISFKMEIGDLVNSTIMQLYPISFAKEMCASITQNMEQDAAANASVTPQPEAKPEPQPTPQPAPQQTMQSQPMMDQGMMGQAMQGQPMMGQPVNVQPAQFQPFMGDLSAAFQKENIDLIMDVPLEVTVELGRTSKSIQEILDFAPGTIIELNKIAGEPIDVLVNGKYVAKGEVVVIEESFGVRITEIIK